YTQRTETKKPFIKGKNFDHPAILESIANDFELGDENKTAILTGPNGCGKSFAAKALALNIILSEKFGCAQAEELEHSFFDIIGYSANVSDKIGNKSRYQ